MAREWDHDDPRDEHDINELRKYVHEGKKPQFVGSSKSSKGGCAVIVFVALAVPVAAAVAAVKGWG